MANIKAMKKDLKRNAKARARNLATKSSLKTFIKKVRVASTAHKEEETKAAIVGAVTAIDKAVQHGIIHKNQAARRKSRMMKKANKALAATAAAK